MSLEAKKEALIERLRAVTDEAQLTRVAQVLEEPVSTGRTIPSDIAKYVKPMRQTIDLEALKREQGYTGADREEIRRIAAELNIQEPLEELLAMLTK